MTCWKKLLEKELSVLSGENAARVDLPSSIDDVLSCLDNHPQIRGLYAKVVGKEGTFTLKHHTSLVIEQYMKHFFIRDLPSFVPKSYFLLLLVLHDIGKPLAIEKGDRNLQHSFTCSLISSLKGSLPFDVKNILALIDGDPLGRYFVGTSLEETLDEIHCMVEKSSLSLQDFFHLLVIYYQVDAGSYAIDEEENPPFSAIFRKDFAFCEQKKRIWFSPSHEKLFNILEKKLLG